MSVLPNLFLVGAQKSATTSLASCLELHSEVFFSSLKEPMFFCYDDSTVLRDAYTDSSSSAIRYKWSLESDRKELLRMYQGLFKYSSDEKYCGEGSTLYLPSRTALDRIKSYCPEAKIIVMLREPFSRTLSALRHFSQRRLIVNIEDYFDNFFASEKDPLGVLSHSFYRAQLEYLFSLFDRSKVCIVFFEDFKRDGKKVQSEIFRFLGLDYDNIPTFDGVKNISLEPRFSAVDKCLVNFCKVMNIRISPKQSIEVEAYQRWVDKENELSPPLKQRFRRVYESILMRPVTSRVELQEETRSKVVNILEKKNLELASILGVKLPKEWMRS